MAGYYEVIGLLKDAQVAMRKADQLIEAICHTGEPSSVIELVAPALQLKECLAAGIAEFERVGFHSTTT